MRIKNFNIILLLFILFVSCEKRDWDNPFDPGCPKEIFTPTNFTATQEGEQVNLTWNQTNPNISGFKIERQVENESFSAIASPDKNENSAANNISAGGKLHTYKLYALAGSNKSNEVTTTISPVLQAAITTKAATEITATFAISGGAITDDGGGPVTSRGIVWNKTGTPTLESNEGKTTDGSGTGSFTSELTGLEENTNYFVKAYATNSRGTVYGNEVSFKTDQSVSLATVTTIFLNLTSTGAVVGGNVTDDGNAEVTERGVCWIWEPWGTQPTKQDSFKIAGSGKGEFSVELLFLESNTNYYVRAYAINEKGISYGEIISFQTAKNLHAPTVYTSVPGEITTNSALLGGQVMDNGDTIVTERGIVYSLSENPTIADNKIEMGAGDGTYSGTVSGLEPNTTYFVRAYAINSEGTGYGEQRNFTTEIIEENETGTFTDSRDGNVYKWVKIGEQFWMAENLAWLPTVNPPSVESYTEKCYYVYNYYGNNVLEAKANSNYKTFGVLYNWQAAMNGSSSSDTNPSGVKGACPSGWHLPSNAEWNVLKNYLINNGFGFGGINIDIAKSLCANTSWIFSSIEGTPGNNLESNNSSGFSGLPGGSSLGLVLKFRGFGEFSYWWPTSDDVNNPETIAWIWMLKYDNLKFNNGNTGKQNGFSIRCVKD